MRANFWAPLCGALVVASCTPKSSVPNGTAVFDEDVTLERQALWDTATREVSVDGDAILVAIVEENLTDVRVRLSAAGVDDAIEPVEVENNLEGAGTEIAALAVPRGARVTVTLVGPQNATTAGAVHLRLRQFVAGARDPKFTAQLAGYQAWSSATAASFRTDEINKTALPAIDRAIASFQQPQGDALLAADALRVKANMYIYFMIEMRKAYEAATQSTEAWNKSGPDHALSQARAQYSQALALGDLATNPQLTNPSPQEANAMARAALLRLAADPSPFGPIERARAITALAMMDRNDSRAEDARKRLDEAMAMYKSAGNVAGEFTTLAHLAQMHVEQGAFPQAAMAYQQLLPNVRKIPDPKVRVSVLIGAGRALGFMGRTDEGIATNLQALELSREYKMKAQQGEVSWELGWLYLFRGDLLQAKALFGDALSISRSLDNNYGLPYTLGSYGTIARMEGDYQTAIDLHTEAKKLAGVPTQRIRIMRGLALDYLAAGRNEEAMAELRGALAVDVQDPNHHIFSDIKRDVAELLANHGGGTPAEFAEAAKLIDQSMRVSVKMEDPFNQVGAYRVRALLQMKQGRYAAARADFDHAFELVFKFRGGGLNPQLRMQSLEQEQPAFRDYFDLMMRAVAARGPGNPRAATPEEEDALRMLERARESHLGLARNAKLDAKAVARVDALLEQMGNKSLQISGKLNRQLNKEEAAELDALQVEMTRLRLELDGVRLAASRQQSAKEAPAVAKARSWRPTPAGTAQLSYALGNEHAYVWVRDNTGLRVATLSLKPEELEKKLAELATFDAQGAPEKIEAGLELLSSVLLPPTLIPQDSKALEIIAEGRIASVAFAGLHSPTDPAKRLVETHAITLITSMYSADQPPRPAHTRPFQLVALASGNGKLRGARPVASMPRLQSATTEIQTIADLFTARDKSAKVKLFAGRDGSIDALRGIWSSGADVVHFATHALADLRQPLASLLVLPAQDASGAPAYLTAGQVQEWRGDADLVFLSACESAIGPPRFAAGMPGLQSAFLRAGARGVIATMWPIEDVLAREFSADFYQRYTRGLGAVQALNDTQRAWLAPKPGMSAAEQQRRRVNAIAHAYFAQ